MLSKFHETTNSELQRQEGLKPNFMLAGCSATPASSTGCRGKPAPATPMQKVRPTAHLQWRWPCHTLPLKGWFSALEISSRLSPQTLRRVRQRPFWRAHRKTYHLPTHAGKSTGTMVQLCLREKRISSLRVRSSQRFGRTDACFGIRHQVLEPHFISA